MDFLGSAKVETVEGNVAEAEDIDGSLAPKEPAESLAAHSVSAPNDGRATPEEPSPVSLNEARVEENVDTSASKPAAEQSESGKRRESTASVRSGGALAPKEAADENAGAKSSRVSAREQAQNDGKLAFEEAAPLAPEEASVEENANTSKKPAAEQSESSVGAFAPKEAVGESVDAKASQASAARQVEDDGKPTALEAVPLAPNEATFEENADTSASKQPAAERSDSGAKATDAVAAGGLEERAEVLAEDKAKGSHIGSEDKLSAEVSAAEKIQAVHRGRQCRKQIEVSRKQELAAMQIQKVQRGKVSRQETEALKESRRKAAERIQAVQRGRLCRQQMSLDRREAAASRIQSLQRQRSARNVARREAAAVRLQALERGRRCRAELLQERERERFAAVQIQRSQRGKAGRKQAEKERERCRQEEKAKRPRVLPRAVVPKSPKAQAKLRTFPLSRALLEKKELPKAKVDMPGPQLKLTGCHRVAQLAQRLQLDELQRQRKSLGVIKGQLRVHLARLALLQWCHVSAVRIQATYRGWKGRQVPPRAKKQEKSSPSVRPVSESLTLKEKSSPTTRSPISGYGQRHQAIKLQRAMAPESPRLATSIRAGLRSPRSPR